MFWQPYWTPGTQPDYNADMAAKVLGEVVKNGDAKQCCERSELEKL